MKGLKWIVVVVLTALLGSAINGVHAKCSLTPIVGERSSWIAYACVQGDLTDVDELPDDVEWIEFTVSRIYVLPPDAFSRFYNLRRLTFYNCDLRDLSNEAFRGLDNLEWLVMSNTQIGLARASLFRHLRSLKRLTLDGAGLVYIEPEVFHYVRRLETLSLRDNDLDCLPIHALSSLSHLKTVQIGRNPWLCDCKNSMIKFFESRRIAHGPEEGCVVPYYNNTNVRTCSNKFYDCMTTLDYPALPAPQSSFQQIEKHYHGRFEWRESVIATAGIANLDRLPDESSWIYIQDIEIPVITRYIFFRFGNTLRSIEITNCGVRDIEREAFAGLHKLERLTMVGNGLNTIGHDWFRDLGRLQQLIIRRNAIERFEEHALVHLRELKTLDISDNRLSCLHEDYLRSLVSLQRLEAAGNPWICGCKSNLENYLIRMRIGYEISAGRCELRVVATNDPPQFTWNSTTTGIIRWSWPSKTHWPPVPRPALPLPTTTTTPRAIYDPPTRPPRTGGCRMINNPLNRLRINSCICLRASLFDLIDVPGTIDTMKFSGSVIPTIHDEAFSKFGRYLKKLELRECSIEKIESRGFHGLWSLENLVIRGNYLEIVESRWFEQMKNLRTLDIARNRIMRIETGVFDNLPHLTKLDVSDNRMNCIATERIESMQHLRELEVTGNPWTCLCATKLLQILRHRGITCNCNPDVLIQRNEGGWGCGHDNHDRHPTTSPSRPVSTLPSTTTPIPIPQPLPTVAVTPIMPPGPPSGNCYKSHETIDGGPWYNCANGDISVLLHIPDSVTKIEIRDSYIPNLPPMIFSRFHNLTDLVLINCTLTDVDQRAFAGLTKLERLTLRHNRFTTVRNGWFSDTKNIASIDMSDNDLSDIEIGSFVGLNYLEYLNFEGNDFRCIYTSCLVGIPRLGTVEFGRNNRRISWRCWEELEEYLVVRGINYTNHNCPHNGRDLVKNLLKDDIHAQRATAGSNESRGARNLNIFAIPVFLIATKFYASILE